MDDTLRDFELEDLHAFRRLRIGCPVYGHFYDLLKLQHAAQAVTPATVAIVPYQGGYYDARTGRYSPIPPPRPTPR